MEGSTLLHSRLQQVKVQLRNTCTTSSRQILTDALESLQYQIETSIFENNENKKKNTNTATLLMKKELERSSRTPYRKKPNKSKIRQQHRQRRNASVKQSSTVSCVVEKSAKLLLKNYLTDLLQNATKKNRKIKNTLDLTMWCDTLDLTIPKNTKQLVEVLADLEKKHFSKKSVPVET